MVTQQKIIFKNSSCFCPVAIMSMWKEGKGGE